MEETEKRFDPRKNHVAVKHEKYYMKYICDTVEKLGEGHEVILSTHFSKLQCTQSILDLFVRIGLCKEKERKNVTGPRGIPLIEITLTKKNSCRTF